MPRRCINLIAACTLGLKQNHRPHRAQGNGIRPLPLLAAFFAATLLFSAGLSGAAFSTSHTHESDDSASAPSAPAAKEMVFIDTRVSDHQTIVDSLQNQTHEGGNLEIVILTPTVDGIQQISEALAGRRQLQAIHIISHGSDGAVELGSTTLDADSLERNACVISRWANSFTAGTRTTAVVEA